MRRANDQAISATTWPNRSPTSATIARLPSVAVKGQVDPRMKVEIECQAYVD